MDWTALVDIDVEGGRRLVAALTAGGLPIASAKWLKERGLPWQLYIASPDVEKYGPRIVYEFVRQIADSLDINLGGGRIVVVDTKNHFSNDIVPVAGDTRDPSYTVEEGPDDGQIEALVYRTAGRSKASKTPPKADEPAIRKARQAA